MFWGNVLPIFRLTEFDLLVYLSSKNSGNHKLRLLVIFIVI
jgi:hypothetical protein